MSADLSTLLSDHVIYQRGFLSSFILNNSNRIDFICVLYIVTSHQASQQLSEDFGSINHEVYKRQKVNGN